MSARAALLATLALAACSAPSETPPPEARGPRPVPPDALHPTPDRLVALGDVHGDFDAMVTALELAEVIDEDGAWIGGETVVVQTGDQLDRGDRERDILDFLPGLADEAWAAGGALLVLSGNHEAMNVELDLRYVTEGGFADFADLAPPEAEQDDELLDYPEEERGRVAAFRPGGPYARVLAGQPVAVQVGDTVFVHGGLLPEHAELGVPELNRRVRDWMLGEAEAPDVIDGDGPLWSREYSDETGPAECLLLEEALEHLGAARMVVGHTVHDRIHSACDEQVWRVDVGMAAYYEGVPQVLEIRGGETRVIE